MRRSFSGDNTLNSKPPLLVFYTAAAPAALFLQRKPLPAATRRRVLGHEHRPVDRMVLPSISLKKLTCCSRFSVSGCLTAVPLTAVFVNRRGKGIVNRHLWHKLCAFSCNDSASISGASHTMKRGHKDLAKAPHIRRRLRRAIREPLPTFCLPSASTQKKTAPKQQMMPVATWT